MKGISAVFLIILGLSVGLSFGAACGNPSDIAPKRSLLVSTEYDYTFLTRRGSVGGVTFSSQRALVRIGYSWFNVVELSAYAGGADWNAGFPHGMRLNGSWELTPGLGFRVRPYNFELGPFKARLLGDAKIFYTRSGGTIPRPAGSFDVYFWWLHSMIYGILALDYKNIGLYGGVFYHYSQITTQWTNKTTGKTAKSYFTVFNPVYPRPVLGFNWYLGKNFTIDIETLPWFDGTKILPTFYLGVSQYN